MTDHTDPVVSSGGFCAPPDELYKLFKPREIPGTIAELALTWDANVTAARERAQSYLMRGRYGRGNRLDLEATAWHKMATTIRSATQDEIDGLFDAWIAFSQAQAQLAGTLPRKTVERRQARANNYVYDLAATELRICLRGGGPMPAFRLPIVTAPRGAIRFITPPPPAPTRPCDCGATDVHELGTGPYCSALAEYGAAAEMDATDELVKAVAQAIRQADYECEIAESVQQPTSDPWSHIARAGLSVPALAEVIARDAKVREIVAERCGCSEFERIAALFDGGDRP